MNPFQNVLVRKPKRSLFDLSHQKTLTCNAGELIPIMCEEVIPGDKFRVSSEVMVRLQPLVAPAMQNMDVYVHFFYVPNRLLWSNWEKFITQGVTGLEAPILPWVTGSPDFTEFKPGGLGDYMGAQFSSIYSKSINALPFAAYQRIVDDYYIDLTLNNGPNMEGKELVDGDNDSNYSAIMSMRTRAWGKDYFTSALPWAQRGGAVELPMTGDANVVRQNGNAVNLVSSATGINISSAVGSDFTTDSNGNFVVKGQPAAINPDGTLVADMSTVSAATVEELRRATKLQIWLEKAARGGSRFYEQIKMFFGVTVPDARLQRAEYLGGGRNPIIISEVLQTSATDQATSPQGNMAGHGISFGSSNQFSRFFPEHGYVFGIMSIMPRASYMGGIRRHLLKRDNFDFAFPDFAQLGEQPIYVDELFGGNNVHGEVFGYAPRYSEYKFIPSMTHGDFRNGGNMEPWTLARYFTTKPVLNNSFIKYGTDERIFAVTDPEIDKYLVNVYNHVRAIRPLPYYNEPSLL